MKTRFPPSLFAIGLATAVLCWMPATNAAESASDTFATEAGPLKIIPINHATFALEWNGRTIYVDPVGGAKPFQGLPKPDLILVTDIHGDHLNKETLAELAGPNTKLICPAAVAEQLSPDLRRRATTLANGQTEDFSGVKVEAIPMYNLTPDRLKFHNKGRGNGYVVTLGGKRIYISGDTEDIPEMLALKDIDVAFVCMNLPYTMTVEQAARAVRTFKPRVVYPYHYRGSDLNQFKELVGTDSGVEVRLRDWYPKASASSTAANAQSGPVKPSSGTHPAVLPLEESASRGITTRDPSSIVKCKDEYWVFYTGHGVPSYHSKDLVKWERGPAVFKTAPEWISKIVPANRDMQYWAPDIMKLGDRYILYYSVSSFGKMTSAIGLATNPTLDPDDPAYHWTDQGYVVRTQDGDGYNAIDPSVLHDKDGSLWLTFGSYWSGIKLVQLDPTTGKRLDPDSKLISLAYNESIEASYLCRHDDYYYLFVNWGGCCQGPKSTYNIRVGRSKTVTGPYVDKAGTEMLHSGGSLFLATTNGPLIGPGHAGTLTAQGKEWFTSDFEGDIRMDGKATLAIMPLSWNSDGWPAATVNDVKPGHPTDVTGK